MSFVLLVAVVLVVVLAVVFELAVVFVVVLVVVVIAVPALFDELACVVVGATAERAVVDDEATVVVVVVVVAGELEKTGAALQLAILKVEHSFVNKFLIRPNSLWSIDKPHRALTEIQSPK
jgi:hypothetical protein